METYDEANFIKDYEPGIKEKVLLKNGKILDVKEGRYLDQGTGLVIEAGKIQSILGQARDSSDLKPDFTIDLQGKPVLPGLFNTHCHITINTPTLLPDLKDIKLVKKFAQKQTYKNMRECLSHGITNIQDAYCEDLRPNRDLKENIASGEVLGPRITQAVAVGPTGSYFAEKYGWVTKKIRSVLGVPTTDHTLKEAGVVEFPVNALETQVRDAVDRALDERGADVIKIGEQLENMTNYKPTSVIMTQDQLNALADQARKRGLRSIIHHVSVDSFRRAVEAGVPSLAHTPMDGHLSKKDAESFLAAGCTLDATASLVYGLCWSLKGVPNSDHPSMGLLTDFRNKTYTDLMDRYLITELKDTAIKLQTKLSNNNPKMFGIMNMVNLFKYYSGIIHYGMDNIKLLYNHGARIACANDAGVPPHTLAMMQHEIDILNLFLNQEPVEKPFSGEDALRVATINSAISMGLENDFGSIEPGKTADLAIVNGDPLKDPHVVGSPVAALFMDGRLVINNCDLKIEKG